MPEMVTPKPIERPSWPLSDRDAMFDALDDLTTEGWRGGITCGQDSVWRIELNHTDGDQVLAQVGQRLVNEPFGGLIVISEQECSDNYDEVE